MLYVFTLSVYLGPRDKQTSMALWQSQLPIQWNHWSVHGWKHSPSKFQEKQTKILWAIAGTVLIPGCVLLQAMLVSDSQTVSPRKSGHHFSGVASQLVIPRVFMVWVMPPLSLTSCFFYFFFLKLFIYFWPCWVFVAASGLSLVAACGLLNAVASLVAEHRL